MRVLLAAAFRTHEGSSALMTPAPTEVITQGTLGLNARVPTIGHERGRAEVTLGRGGATPPRAHLRHTAGTASRRQDAGGAKARHDQRIFSQSGEPVASTGLVE